MLCGVQPGRLRRIRLKYKDKSWLQPALQPGLVAAGCSRLVATVMQPGSVAKLVAAVLN